MVVPIMPGEHTKEWLSVDKDLKPEERSLFYIAGKDYRFSRKLMRHAMDLSEQDERMAAALKEEGVDLSKMSDKEARAKLAESMSTSKVFEMTMSDSFLLDTLGDEKTLGGVIGWENVYAPNGDPIPFDVKTWKSHLRWEWLMELAQKVFHAQFLDEEDQGN